MKKHTHQICVLEQNHASESSLEIRWGHLDSREGDEVAGYCHGWREAAGLCSCRVGGKEGAAGGELEDQGVLGWEPR